MNFKENLTSDSIEWNYIQEASVKELKYSALNISCKNTNKTKKRSIMRKKLQLERFKHEFSKDFKPITLNLDSNTPRDEPKWKTNWKAWLDLSDEQKQKLKEDLEKSGKLLYVSEPASVDVVMVADPNILKKKKKVTFNLDKNRVRIIDDRHKIVKRTKYEGKTIPKTVNFQAVLTYKNSLNEKPVEYVDSSESEEDEALHSRHKSNVLSGDDLNESNIKTTLTEAEKRKIMVELFGETSEEDSDKEPQLVIQEDMTDL